MDVDFNVLLISRFLEALSEDSLNYYSLDNEELLIMRNF